MTNRNDTKKTVKILAICLMFLFIFTYAIFRSKELILGVRIKNVNIKDGITVTENPLKIKGNAKHAIKLNLNGREISIDQKGNFEEDIVLLSGYNVIEINAKDKFGNNNQKNYQLMY